MKVTLNWDVLPSPAKPDGSGMLRALRKGHL